MQTERKDSESLLSFSLFMSAECSEYICLEV